MTTENETQSLAVKLVCEDCSTVAYLPKIGREKEFVSLKPADGWELYPHCRCPKCSASTRRDEPCAKK